MMKAISLGIGLAISLALTVPAKAVTLGKPVHALALLGDPKYGPDFKQFDYVNPNAPKGGTIVVSNLAASTFDTFNPFTLKGVAAFSIGLMHEALMVGAMDEPSADYCQICQTVEVAPDNTWVEFKLRPAAKFSDGSPITAEDVAFSYTTLIEKGAPAYKLYWPNVDKVDVKDKATVRFVFKDGSNSELPMILGQLPVISKAYWSKRDFTATTLEVPVSSGAYTIESFEVGRRVIYKRVPNYWAADLPVNRGTNNFDRIRVEYFRDNTVQFEAFKSGAFDYWPENTARRWATSYDFPAVKEGRVKRLEVVDGSPMTHQSLIFNLRRPLFQDRRVREAIGLAFDFEGMNKTVFYNQYQRLRSYWQRSELEARGLPSAAELVLLNPLKDKIPPEVFTQEFQQPVNNTPADFRNHLLRARDLLKEAGWDVKDGNLQKDGKQFTFEVLDFSATAETVLGPWLKNLERLGIKATLRVIDTTQYSNRMTDYDFDATTIPGSNSLSPGNEQSYFWGSDAAARSGSPNYSGVKDPAVDSLIATIIDAKDRATLVAATHALDRVLTWNYYRALTYSAPFDRFAYWDRLQKPPKEPLMGLGPTGAMILTTWWMDPKFAAEKR